MSKKKEISEDIESLTKSIDDLSKSSRLKDIFKKYGQVKSNLEKSSQKLQELRETFEAPVSAKKTIIDNETYEKYCKELSDYINDENFEELSIEDQITNYKIYMKRIILCENYLKSKKLEIIKCSNDEKIPTNDITTSESSDSE